LISSVEESERIALSVNDNNGVYIVPAFVGLGAPFWNQECRGIISGLTLGSDVRHILRAALEAIAYQSQEVLSCLVQDTGLPISKLRADGGASGNKFLMQFQADISDVEVEVQDTAELTAKGAFLLAGLGTGMFSDARDMERAIRIAEMYSPAMERSERERLITGWRRAVARALQ
jgi:glycerol kinase